MSDTQPCPECNGMYAYPLDALLICPECGHEWNPDTEVDENVIKDVNGNILNDGDSVTVVKDLKVKGAGITLKKGTVVKNIRLTDDPDEIDCKIKKSAIVLRTEFIQKM